MADTFRADLESLQEEAADVFKEHYTDDMADYDLWEAADYDGTLTSLIDSSVPIWSSLTYLAAYMGDDIPTDYMDAGEETLNDCGWDKDRGISHALQVVICGALEAALREYCEEWIGEQVEIAEQEEGK